MSQPFLLSNWRNGVNRTDAIDNLGGGGWLTEGNNISLDQNGYVRERDGSSQYGNTISGATTILGLHGYKKYSTGVVYPLMVHAAEIYWNNAGTWTAQSQSLTTGLSASFVDAFDVVYFTNGTDNVRTWNGSSWTTKATMKKGDKLAFFENRIFTAGVSGEADTVYYTDIATDTQTKTAYIEVGEAVTALLPADRFLWIFTRNDIYSIERMEQYDGVAVGPEALTKLQVHKGAMGKNCVCKVGPWVYFVANDGIYRTDGSSLTLITADCKEDWAAINPATLAGSAIVEFENRIYVALRETGQTVNNVVFVFDTTYLHQSPTTGEALPAYYGKYDYTDASIYPAMFAVIDVTGNEKRLYCGDSATGKVFRLEDTSVTADDGTAIDSYVTMPLVGDDALYRKRWTRGFIRFATVGDYYVDIYARGSRYAEWNRIERADISSIGSTRDNFVRGEILRSQEDEKEIVFRPNYKGRYFECRIRNENLDEPWTLSNLGGSYRTIRRIQNKPEQF